MKGGYGRLSSFIYFYLVEKQYFYISKHSCPVKLGYYKMSQLRCSVFLSDVVVLQRFSNRIAMKLAA